MILGLLPLIIFGVYVTSIKKISIKNPVTCEQRITCLNCNLLIISADSLRADHVSEYGYTRNTTPNFDNLAKTGALFTNYFTTAFLTPISEMSLHTGMYPSTTQYKKFEAPMSDKYLTVAQILKNDSYYTFAMHSSPEFTHYPYVKKSFERGFDYYNSFEPKLKVLDIRKTPDSDSFAEMLDSVKEKKFFGWITYGGIHWPYGYSSKNVYGDTEYNGYLKGERLDWSVFQNIYNGTVYPQRTKLTAKDHQYIIDMYDNGVKQFDNYLGELMKTLKKKGLLENTIVVISSEHGESLGERGYYAHYDIFDEQINTPLLIIYPNSKNKTISTMVSSVDVLPTTLELLGIGIPAQVQGKSVIPQICGDENNSRNEVFIERSPTWEEGPLRMNTVSRGIDIGENARDIAIRNKDWKLILRYSRERMEKESWWAYISGKKINIPQKELYNLKSDPHEKKNVILDYPEIVKDLEDKLKKWDLESTQTNKDGNEYPMIQQYF